MYVVEYSISQNCFHIETIDEALKRNIIESIKKIKNDYKIIDICKNFEEANKSASKFRGII